LKKTNVKYAYIALAAVLVLTIGLAIYLTFFYTPKCENYSCFQTYMAKCDRVVYVNEEPEASWGYKIEGTNDDNCVVDVTLLNAKKGELDIVNLVGDGMKCYYPTGTSAYPEKDLSKCHGILKEELQDRVISKLHSYLIENLGKLNANI